MSSYLSHKRKGFQGAAPAAFNGFGNRSRSFDGVDNNVNSIGTTSSFNFIHISKVFTITLWVKWDEYNTNNAGALVANNYAGSSRGFLLQLDNRSGIVSNGIRFIIYNGNTGQLEDLKIDNCVPDSGWHHWALRSDGSTVSAYRDGTFIGSYNYQYTATGNAENELGLGVLPNPTTPLNHINGNLADVRIYDTDLTATDISDIYNGTNITTNLVGHWLTDADNLLDAAGTNHGTNIGSKYSYDNPSPPVEFGSASRSFDGVDDYIDFGDSDLFSFGDGLSDSPFSVSAWIKPKRTNTFRVLGKYSNIAGVREWIFTSDANSLLILFIFDESTNGGLHKKCAADPITNYSDQWVHVSCTYDGSSNSNGVKLYINGVESQDTDNSAGTYVAMENTTEPLIMGSLQGVDYSEGNISDTRLYNTDLTATQISDLYNGTDVQTNLVGHWLTDNDDVEDKAGTNDGTNFGSTYSIDNPPLPLVPSRQASRSFDGVANRVEITDNNDHSFGDGLNDYPFSVSAWIKIEATNKAFRILSKWSDVSGAEWAFTTDSSDRLALFFRQVSTDGLIKRYYSTSLSSYLNQWVHVSATYDGRGGGNAGDGIDLYLNGVNVDNANDNTGSYTAMENQNTPTYIGVVQVASGYSLAQGKIADVRLYDAELTASQILDIYNGTTDRTNLVGQWLTNSDDVLDHAGTNDGTNFGSTYSTDSPS